MQSATDIYATKMPIGDRAFGVNGVAYPMRFKISRGIPQTLEEKRARVGELIEHADHSQLINSSTLSQRVTVVTLNRVWTRNPLTVPGMDYKTFTARRSVMGMKMEIAGPKRRASSFRQRIGVR